MHPFTRSKARLIGVVLLAATVLTGCNVNLRSNQLDTARAVVTGLIPSEQRRLQREAEQYAWLFKFNDMEFVVYPVQASGRAITFANGSGLRIFWDGDTVHTIENMPGAFGRYIAGLDGERRWYERRGYEPLWVDCPPKREWQLLAERKGWRQECRGEFRGRPVRTMHNVETDAEGRVRLIEMTLWPTVPPASLRPIGAKVRV
jgi:hypothetical protein